MRTIHTSSEEETVETGRGLAAELRVGDVVLIEGPLGAGKTAFVRGLAEGLRADPGEVSSPTFTILQQYRAAWACGLGVLIIDDRCAGRSSEVFH